MPDPSRNVRPHGRMRASGAHPLVCALSLALAAAALEGCSECSAGQAECDGDQIKTCVVNAGLVGEIHTWNFEACTAPNSYCVSGTLNASMGASPICVASTSPVAACAPTAPRLCWNDSVLNNCTVEGYPIAQSPCPDGTSCRAVLADHCAFCDDGTAVDDPTCVGGGATTCFAGSVFGCSCGMRQGAEQSCVSSNDGGACVVGATGPVGGPPTGFCALSSQQDPNCPDSSDYGLFYCAGIDSILCRDGFSTGRRACGCSNTDKCVPGGDGERR